MAQVAVTEKVVLGQSQLATIVEEGLAVDKLSGEHCTLHIGVERNQQYWLACLLFRMIVDDR